MFSASDLTAEQVEVIKGWVSSGDQMSDVQRRLKDDLGFKVTYMDTRFLSLDLGLEYISEQEPVVEPELESPDEVPAQPEAAGEKPVDQLTADDVEFTPGLQPVSITVDTVARPGAMVSGTVTFSDGEKGAWLIDNQGQPSIDPDTPGYRPIEADLVEFQMQLRDALQGHM